MNSYFLSEDEVKLIAKDLNCEKCGLRLMEATQNRKNVGKWHIKLAFDSKKGRIFVCLNGCRP